MNSIDIRINKLREEMSRNGIDFCVITTSDPHMSEYIPDYYKLREYFTGFTGSAGTLLVSADSSYLWTDGRYFIQAKEELSETSIILMKDGLSDTLPIHEVIKQTGHKGCCVGLDYSVLSKAYVDNLCNKLSGFASIVNANGIIDSAVENRPPMIFNKLSLAPYKERASLFDERIAQIRLAAEKLCDFSDYTFIVTELGNIMWTFLVRGSDIRYVPVAYSYAIITNMRLVIYLNKIALSEETISYFDSINVEVKDYSSFESDVSELDSECILVDKNNCNNMIFDLIPRDTKKIYVDENQLIRKDIKNAEELEAIRNYHIDDAVSVVRFIKYVKENVNSGRLNELNAGQYLDNLRLTNTTCNDLSFSTICAYGENAAIVHYEASEKSFAAIEPKGFLLVDSGGQYPLCTTDITRTIALGELTQEEKIYYTTVLRGHLALLKAVFIKGTKGENLDILARQYLWNMGADYRHGTGHGIGCQLSVHEGGPSVRYKISLGRLSADLTPGMIISDEPGYYEEGKFGIRIENELEVVYKNNTSWGDFYGFESLTLVPYEREAIIVSMLSDEEIDMIDKYHERIYSKLSCILDEDEREWLKYATLPLKSART